MNESNEFNKLNIDYSREGLVSIRGYDFVKNKGVVVLFISPENSYYSEENIHKHISCCADNFSQVYVMIPEGPLVHNYLAEGYEKSAAERKSRLKCNNLRNKTQRSINELVEKTSVEMGIIDWNIAVNQNNYYMSELNLFNKLYDDDENFRDNVNNVVMNVLGTKIDCKDLENNIVEGGKYVLEELAFMSAAPKMLGKKELAFAYHKDWKIFEDYVNGKYSKKEEQKIGLIVIN